MEKVDISKLDERLLHLSLDLETLGRLIKLLKVKLHLYLGIDFLIVWGSQMKPKKP